MTGYVRMYRIYYEKCFNQLVNVRGLCKCINSMSSVYRGCNNARLTRLLNADAELSADCVWVEGGSEREAEPAVTLLLLYTNSHVLFYTVSCSFTFIFSIHW